MCAIRMFVVLGLLAFSYGSVSGCANTFVPKVIVAQSPPKPLVLQSRNDVRNAFGQDAVALLPTNFDFEQFAIVWLPHDVNENARVQLHTVADSPVTIILSEHSSFVITVQKPALVVQSIYTYPCVTGRELPPDVAAECQTSKRREEQEAVKVRHLLVVPRTALGEIKVIETPSPVHRS